MISYKGRSMISLKDMTKEELLYLMDKAKDVKNKKITDILKGKIDVIEMLGKEKILYIKMDTENTVTISVPGHHKFVEGEEYYFDVDNQAIHFFNKKTGERINSGKYD